MQSALFEGLTHQSVITRKLGFAQTVDVVGTRIEIRGSDDRTDDAAEESGHRVKVVHPTGVVEVYLLLQIRSQIMVAERGDESPQAADGE